MSKQSVTACEPPTGSDKFISFLEEQESILDWTLTIDVGHKCGWGGKLRLTQQLSGKEATEETIILSVAGSNPEHIVELLEKRAREVMKALPARGIEMETALSQTPEKVFPTFGEYFCHEERAKVLRG